MAEEIKEAKQAGVVSAKSNYLEEKGYEEVQVDYPFPGTVAELIEKFGEKVVHSNAVGAFTVSLQSNLRRWAKSMIEPKEKGGEEGEVDPNTLQALADKWRPGVVSRVKKSKVDKTLALADDIEDPAELDELIKKLQAKKAAKK